MARWVGGGSGVGEGGGGRDGEGGAGGVGRVGRAGWNSYYCLKNIEKIL